MTPKPKKSRVDFLARFPAISARFLSYDKGWWKIDEKDNAGSLKRNPAL
ncbi:hypothetical protein ACFL6Y_05175 [Elusimicrobiota bacterium]